MLIPGSVRSPYTLLFMESTEVSSGSFSYYGGTTSGTQWYNSGDFSYNKTSKKLTMTTHAAWSGFTEFMIPANSIRGIKINV